jgi:hypothetical protein
MLIIINKLKILLKNNIINKYIYIVGKNENLNINMENYLFYFPF